MDAGGLAAAKQSLEVLKSVPVWLLLSLSTIIAVVWWSPQFSGQLPPALQTALPLALFVTATLALFKLLSIAIENRLAKRQLARARDLDRLEKLYRPLISLFLNRHLTTSTGIAAPRLSHRLANAWDELGAYRRRRTGVKRAWRALFDRQESTSAEVEFGGDFPLSEIVSLVRENSIHASRELNLLVRRANRSRYEEPGLSLLTDEEVHLFQHIDRKYRQLSSMFE